MAYKTLIVTGSRHAPDSKEQRDDLRRRLDRLRTEYGISEVVVGDAKGVDAEAAQWASENGIEVYRFKADWHQFSRSAGPRRNAEMVASCAEGSAIVLAYCGSLPLSKCKGTSDMVRRCQKREMTIFVVDNLFVTDGVFESVELLKEKRGS